MHHFDTPSFYLIYILNIRIITNLIILGKDIRLAASRRSQNQVKAAVKVNHFLLELVILILPVEGICREFVERVVAWSRDATIWGMGCVGGGHN